MTDKQIVIICVTVVLVFIVLMAGAVLVNYAPGFRS